MARSNVSRDVVACAVCAVLASAALGATPTVGPQQRIDVAGGTAAANETTGSVSAVNPTDIVAGWNDWRESPAFNEIIRCGFALSVDGGSTWSDFVVRPPSGFQSSVEGDPMTASDPRTGTVWAGGISFSSNGGLYLARKGPLEDHFQPAVMADVGGGIDKAWMVAGRNHLTADSTRVYITYNFGIVRSDDLGDTWTNPIDLGPGVGFLPRIGPNGEVYVSTWNWANESFQVQRSLDGGVSFVTRVIAPRMDSWGVETFNTRFAGTFRVAPLPGLAVDPNDGTLYAVWPDTTDQAGGQANVDVYFSRSIDQGDTWSVPVILNGEGPNVGDQFFPWIEADAEGRLHVVYFDSRHTAQLDGVVDGFFDAYYAYSEDQGATWNELRLTAQSWNSDDDGLDRPEQFIGDYLGMGVTDDTAWPIYMDTSSGDTDVFTREISFAECPTPEEVSGLTVTLAEDSESVTVNWTNGGFVFSYVVFEDTAPEGGFATEAGSGPSGNVGVTLPTPEGDRFYLVAGSNGCGIGAK